jgi:hypothetical protein
MHFLHAQVEAKTSRTLREGTKPLCDGLDTGLPRFIAVFSCPVACKQLSAHPIPNAQLLSQKIV